MNIKRIFATINAKGQSIVLIVHGIFCALESGVYQCIYAFQYRLLPSTGSRDTSVFDLIFGEIEGSSLLFFTYSNTYQICQRSKVSGMLRITVSAILRQQRDSLRLLYHLQNSHSAVWMVLVTPCCSMLPVRCTSVILSPNGSVSRGSVATGSPLLSSPPE